MATYSAGAGITLTALNQELSRKAEARLQALLDADPQFAALGPEDSLMAQCGNMMSSSASPELGTSIQVVHALMKTYAERVAFYQCPPDGDWDTHGRAITYSEVWTRITRLATALQSGGHLKRGGFVGIAGFASVDWTVADVASLYIGAVVVPIPLNVPPSDMVHILTEAEVSVVCCSEAELKVLAPVLHECPNVSTVVVMDTPHEAIGEIQLPQLPSSVAAVATMAELEAKGAGMKVPPPAIPGQDGWEANPLLGLMYTSGSTGAPKGAMYPENLVYLLWARGFNWNSAKVISPSISLGFMPLNHIAGRVTLYQTLAKGGATTFVRRADMSTLFEDLARARPTSLLLVPRISNMVYETAQILRGKLRAEHPSMSDEAIEQDVRRTIRDEVLGGRIFSIISGTAPTSPEVTDFLRDCVEAPVVDGYGSTECGGVTIDHSINRRTVLDAKLIDVPDLGYLSSDKPWPRGELCVKTKTGIPGYYKNPKATADLMDEDGYYHMGDVMEHRGGDVYVWVDRVKSVLKLCQGEFVSVSRVEAVYSAHAAIHQIYIYGNSHRAYLLAVIVPSSQWIAGLKQKGEDTSDAAIRERLRQAVEGVARENRLQACEVPREIILEHEAFSRANSLLTDSNKPARSRLRTVYGPRLEALYDELEKRREERLQNARAAGANGHLSIAERVRAALEMTLGVEAPLSGDATFRQLGGDSLASVRFVGLLKEMTGADISVAVVLDPSMDMGRLARLVEGTQREEEEEERVYKAVHGDRVEKEGKLRASDLQLEKFIPPQELEAVLASGPENGSGQGQAGKVVFLTGATGFLGRNLLLDLLTHVARSEKGKVVCLVREAGDAAARRRLLEESIGPVETSELRRKLQPMEQRLEVLAGDVSRLRLGLSESAYARLCAEVDVVVHAGALVNHHASFDYRSFFGPNVLGTVSVLRLCLAGKRKPLHYISTVAAAMGPHLLNPDTTADGPTVITEDRLGAALCEERPTGPHIYASGYGASKWASEVLLQKACQQFGLPVSVYRCSMILPHAKLLGVVNRDDVFTRLLSSVVTTGLAPGSFFPQGAKPVCYDGNAVDIVSGVVVAMVEAAEGGLQGYHVVNPHLESGASLDDIVKYVRSAGYAVASVEDYATWFSRFGETLAALPERERNRSLLPLLDTWQRPMRGRGEGIVLDAAHFRQAVKGHMGLRDVPLLDEAYIHHVLRSMVALGIILPPSAK